MRDISAKSETHREAIAETFVRMPASALRALRDRRLEKGDALEIARVAAIMAAKRTHELIPFCHSIPIAHVMVDYDLEEAGVRVRITVRSNAPTGVEMEALTGASLAALTLYDMLKPHTSELEIEALRLVAKTGGKTDFHEGLAPPASLALISLTGEKDRAGAALAEVLDRDPRIAITEHLRLAGGAEPLLAQVRQLVDRGTELIFTVGGTGLSPDDFAVEALRPLVDREIPGIMEAARAYGQRRTPYAMLSRGFAGLIGETLLVTLPGSSRGVIESHAAIFPTVLHYVSGRRRHAERR